MLLDQLRYPESLPITARRDEIVEAIRANQVVIVAGETGSGNSCRSCASRPAAGLMAA